MSTPLLFALGSLLLIITAAAQPGVLHGQNDRSRRQTLQLEEQDVSAASDMTVDVQQVSNKRCVAGVGFAAQYQPGYLFTTTDSGTTWVQRGSRENWVTVAASSDGSRLVAIKENYGMRGEGGIYTSDSSGVVWTRIDYHDPSRHHISNTADGRTFVSLAAPDDVNGRFIYVSTDRGNSWDARGAGRNWSCGAVSTSGARMVASEYRGYIYTSDNLGRTLTSRISAGLRPWTSVASSADGMRLAAVADGANVWTSTNAGVTWTEQTASLKRAWTSIASSADGLRLVAATTRRIFVSLDGGVKWRVTGPVGTWTSVATTGDFNLIMAVGKSTQVAVSKDQGKTWAKTGTIQNWSSVACQQ